jgi:hypothetical protein
MVDNLASVGPQTWTTPPMLPTTPITYHTTNPYSRFIIPYPPTYYSPYPYHIPTFYHPDTPPTQWRKLSHIPKTGSFSQNLNSK